MNEAIKDIKPLPTRWYALCEGKGLRVCDSCRRNVVENPDAAKNPNQAFITPVTSGDRCGDWMQVLR